jgi:1-deoxy-D-xylulose-5-phosphate reductoisomerase
MASSDRMKKRVIVLGSTGSIGSSSLAVLDAMREEWDVVGLAAGTRYRSLAEQASRYRPEAIALAEKQHEPALREALTFTSEVWAGPDAMVRLVEQVPCDCVVSAVVGAEGLPATLRAVDLGRRIALANKETLVIAGSLVMPLAAKSGATIIPVDSEHSAVFQALRAGRTNEIRTVYLTASGGPFRTSSLEAMEDATLEEALRHPTWNMGPKVTIDSATMMNKALEIVEARWLFDLEPDQIQVVVHPESIIHSLVEFTDGSLIAQLGTPDMRTPIQYALTYPERRPCPSERLDLREVGRLNLESPDVERFPALRLGHEVAQRGGTSGAVLNAANEAAVELFRSQAIRFCDIARYTEQALRQHDFKESPTLEDLLAADDWARKEVTRCMTC